MLLLHCVVLPLVQAGEAEGAAAMNVQLSLDETYADITPVRHNPESISAFVSIMRGCNNSEWTSTHLLSGTCCTCSTEECKMHWHYQKWLGLKTRQQHDTPSCAVAKQRHPVPVFG